MNVNQKREKERERECVINHWANLYGFREIYFQIYLYKSTFVLPIHAWIRLT